MFGKSTLRFTSGIIFCCSIGLSSEFPSLNFEKIFTSTSPSTKIMEVSMQSLSSGEITDRNALLSAANSGDYVAQYVISLKDGSDSRQKFNGERTALLKEKALLLLLSAIKGNYWKSKDELKEVAEIDVSTTDYSASSLTNLVELATTICEKL